MTSNKRGFLHVGYRDTLVGVVVGERFPDWWIPGAAEVYDQAGVAFKQMWWEHGRRFALDAVNAKRFRDERRREAHEQERQNQTEPPDDLRLKHYGSSAPTGTDRAARRTGPHVPGHRSAGTGEAGSIPGALPARKRDLSSDARPPPCPSKGFGRLLRTCILARNVGEMAGRGRAASAPPPFRTPNWRRYS
jgi:hypothetical protein